MKSRKNSPQDAEKYKTIKIRNPVFAMLCRRYQKLQQVNGVIGKLMPNGRSSCGSIQKPRWHSFEVEFQEGVTNQEYLLTLQTIGNILINNAVTMAQWNTIIKNAKLFFSTNATWLENLVEYCKNASETEKTGILNLLRSEISKNRKFCNSDWAIPEKFLKEMEVVLGQLTPDGIQKYEFLFKSNPDLLSPVPFDRNNFNYEEEQNYLYNLRIETAHKILDKYGADILMEFSFKAEATRELAEVIVKDVFQSKYNFSQILLAKKKIFRFIVQYYITYIKSMDWMCFGRR